MIVLDLTLPIYWTKEFKTKPNKTVLCSLNWFRNAHYIDQNKWKQEFHHLIKDQLPNNVPEIDTYKLFIKLYYKNINSDGSNVSGLIEKVVLDALQEYNLVPQDSVKHHLGSSWVVQEQDKNNPRAEVQLIKVM